MKLVKLFVACHILIACSEVPSWIPGSNGDDEKSNNKSATAPEVSESSLPEDPIYSAISVLRIHGTSY